MADFVAVIRRAVDGLANNTPEMRAKVYDKARSAVQRQLENMKPRPPEDMLARQMEKLEAAIVSVEEEHAEALPAAEEAAPVLEAPVDQASAETVEQPPASQEEVSPEKVSQGEQGADQYHAPEAVAAQPEAHAESHSEEYRSAEPHQPVETAQTFREEGYEPPVSRQDDDQSSAVEEPVSEPLPEQAVPVSAEEPVHPEPTAPHYGDWRDDVPPEEPLPPSSSYDHQEPARAPALDIAVKDHIPVVPGSAAAWVEPASGTVHAEDDFPYPTRGDEGVSQHAAAETVPAWGDSAAPEAVAPVASPIASEEPKPVDSWAWEAPAPAVSEPPAAPPSHEADMAAAWNDVPELVPAGPVEPIDRGSHAEHVEAHFDAETRVAADTVRMPTVAELPDLPQQPVAAAVGTPAFVDPLADFLDAHSTTAAPRAQEALSVEADTPAAKPVEQGAAPAKAADSDPWNDLEELIGFNKDGTLPGATSARGAGGMHTEADAEDLMSAPARPYRVKPARKRNYAGILLGIVGLALVGGGGYAVWLNRDSLNDMVDGLIQSSLPGSSQTAQQAPAPSGSTPARPSTSAPSTSTPAPNANSTAAPAAPAGPNTAANNTATPPRPADGAATGNKFTQRLMPDGTETDQGPGSAGTLAQNAEGQSVAQLNAPPRNQPAGAAGNANPPTATPNTASPANPAPSAGPADVPAAAGEKMFLYEERIGQAAPTAIDGTVSWSLQREAQPNGRQEPVIQGRLTVPGRGLSALLTIKRNNDSSLPASHLIEIVFALPPDFEGGAIDSVQRIAMKSSEQDRGNALIAVPAKITDDFHMIALNDFPDARATNLELLRSRPWMDIPMAYRNGRRSLLTLQKGAQGEKVFNDAIREWGTLNQTTSGQ